ncbi:MAG: GNAT family N-acetyltransferase [Hydrogenophilus sp.]|nr:GNAT family N-acetyltransferase [Hydrogenophilus sp.]
MGLLPTEIVIPLAYCRAAIEHNHPALAFSLARRAEILAPTNPYVLAALLLSAALAGEREFAEHYAHLFWPRFHELLGDRELLKYLAQHTLSYAPYWRAPLTGRRLHLEPLTADHRPQLIAWREDRSFADDYNFFLFADEASIDAHLSAAAQHPLDAGQQHWIILDAVTRQPIGLASLASFDLFNLRAEFLIGIQPLEHRRRSGLALEASLLILEYAFSTLGLHKLFTFVYEHNTYSQKSTEHLGFTREAILTEHVLHPRDGKYLSMFQNGLLARTYRTDPRYQRFAQKLLGRPLQIPGPRYLHHLRAAHFPPGQDLPD